MGATLSDKIEGALASQEMRQAFFGDKWTDLAYSEEQEKRIQPASYEPIIEDRCWRVPDGFRPEPGVSVLESLRRLNPRERPEYRFSDNGIVAYAGFPVLFPLEGNWNVPAGFFIKASPKSTEGRMGNFARIIADGSPKYDEVRGPFTGKMYVMVKPLAFNNLVFPGFSFTQLRAYCRNQSIVSDAELLRLINQHQLVKHNQEPLPIADIQLENGLLLSADLEGKESDGVVGFRARKNPDPVDRRALRKIDWEPYWDALLAPKTGQFELQHGEFDLVQSWEWVEMTSTYAGVMAEYRTNLMENRAHIAGYFDANKFAGVATLEIPVIDPMPLRHRQLMCAVQYEAMRAIPDKLYTGAHQNQKFALIPKPFKLPNSADIAGRVTNEKELIMYVDRAKLFGQDHFDGFCPAERVDFQRRILEQYDFGIRGSAEKGSGLEADDSKKQPICYTVFVNPREKSVFAYRRASDPTKYAETRLYDQLSIGVGGHVRKNDKVANAANPLLASLLREAHGEEIELQGTAGEPKLIGYINADNARPVDAVHFGLLYVIEVDGAVRPKDPEIKEGRMMPISEFSRLVQGDAYEVWTKIAAGIIERMYR